jgi:hypothetical protein
VKKIAEHFGVCRATIRSQLIREGVKPRGRGEAMIVRHASMTREQRQQLARAANEASRGIRRSIETKRKIARVRKRIVGEGEHVIADALKDRGIEFIPQAPIHIYNIDLLVDGRIAVEPSAGNLGKIHQPEWF